MSKLTGKDQTHIDKLIATAKEYNKANNFQQALNYLIKAWDDLPEPRMSLVIAIL